MYGHFSIVTVAKRTGLPLGADDPQKFHICVHRNSMEEKQFWWKETFWLEILLPYWKGGVRNGKPGLGFCEKNQS